MAFKFTESKGFEIVVLLIMSNFLTLPSVEAKPSDIENKIIVNNNVDTIHGNNKISVNENSDGQLGNSQIELNQNIKTIHGSNTIYVNEKLEEDENLIQNAESNIETAITPEIAYITANATTKLPAITPEIAYITADATTKLPVPVPSGFEKLEDGRVIRRTVRSDPRSNYYDTQMDFCDQYGAKPFIPRTQADYLLYKEVRESLGTTDGSMWLPANDKQEEGTLRWFNGEVASNTLFRWRNGQELIANSASDDCVLYGCCSNDDDGVLVPDVFLYPCNIAASYPPICEII